MENDIPCENKAVAALASYKKFTVFPLHADRLTNMNFFKIRNDAENVVKHTKIQI